MPSVYVFRGIVQEADPKLTLFPAGDIGLALKSGDGGLKSVGVNFGVWNSLQTGSSGFDGPTGKLHYEEDFYATLSLGFGGGVGLATTYTSYTSPNGMFPTVKEIAFKVSKTHMVAPYGIVAFELDDDGQADGGANKGTYLELGVGPSWPLGGGKATLTVPVKVGLSLKDYYEGFDGDSKFGFFDVGALITVPLSRDPQPVRQLEHPRRRRCLCLRRHHQGQVQRRRWRQGRRAVRHRPDLLRSRRRRD